MGRPAGGSRVEGGLEELRQALYNYYGAISELKTLAESDPSLASQVEIPEKPEALVLWEQCQANGIPLVSGGLLDQPHIWLEEQAVVISTQRQFDAITRGQEDARI